MNSFFKNTDACCVISIIISSSIFFITYKLFLLTCNNNIALTTCFILVVLIQLISIILSCFALKSSTHKTAPALCIFYAIIVFLILLFVGGMFVIFATSPSPSFK